MKTTWVRRVRRTVGPAARAGHGRQAGDGPDRGRGAQAVSRTVRKIAERLGGPLGVITYLVRAGGPGVAAS